MLKEMGRVYMRHTSIWDNIKRGKNIANNIDARKVQEINSYCFWGALVRAATQFNAINMP